MEWYYTFIENVMGKRKKSLFRGFFRRLIISKRVELTNGKRTVVIKISFWWSLLSTGFIWFLFYSDYKRALLWIGLFILLVIPALIYSVFISYRYGTVRIRKYNKKGFKIGCYYDFEKALQFGVRPIVDIEEIKKGIPPFYYHTGNEEYTLKFLHYINSKLKLKDEEKYDLEGLKKLFESNINVLDHKKIDLVKDKSKSQKNKSNSCL